MPTYAIIHPTTGQITQMETRDEVVELAPDWMADDQHSALETHMAEWAEDGSVHLIERPKLFDNEILEIKVGDTIKCIPPKHTRILYDRPDLPLFNDQIQVFSGALEDGEFSFSADKPGQYSISFRNAFPYQNQNFKVIVR